MFYNLTHLYIHYNVLFKKMLMIKNPPIIYSSLRAEVLRPIGIFVTIYITSRIQPSFGAIVKFVMK